MGAAYDPARDRWRRLAPAPLRDRFAATAVWTGREMMVWGGTSARLHDDEEMGAAYDPARDRWRRLPPAPLQGRAGHTAVWTGEEMLVYGGNALERTPGVFADGAAFDPVADRWRMLPPTALLQPRTGTSSVWTGEEMLVWGGAGERFHPDGAGYSPRHDRWRPLSAAPLSDAAGYPAVWTGGTMLVWGGRQDPSGAAYRPVIGLRLRRLNDPYPR